VDDEQAVAPIGRRLVDGCRQTVDGLVDPVTPQITPQCTPAQVGGRLRGVRALQLDPLSRVSSRLVAIAAVPGRLTDLFRSENQLRTADTNRHAPLAIGQADERCLASTREAHGIPGGDMSPIDRYQAG
jgi:hypothetical protein